MPLPWVLSFRWGEGLSASLSLSHPMRPFVKKTRVEAGGFAVVASRARQSYVIHMRRRLDLSLVVTEAQFDLLSSMVEWSWANLGTPIQVSLEGSWVDVYLVDPEVGSDFTYSHAEAYGWVSCSLGLERHDGAPWDLRYFNL